MAKKVNRTPALSVDQNTSPLLIQQLVSEFASHAYRLNVALPMDGSEAMTAPLPLMSYTVAGLPSAASNLACIVFVSNGTANKRLAVSDGTNWRWPDGAIVS